MSSKITLSPQQKSIVQSEIDQKIFLEGPAGNGKTTAALHRMKFLVDKGVNAGQILILTPQRSLAEPYHKFLYDTVFPSGELPTIVTMGGFAQRLIDLFWPVVAHLSGFSHPERYPVFLTMESAQYFLSKLLEPLIMKGYFDSLVISRPRLCSQILDGLNKSALIGFEHESYSNRLKSAWIGEPAQITVYDQAQEVAVLFRRFCLEHSLLDFSLQMELFVRHLWPSFLIQKFLKNKFAHLIFDNIEEDSPVAHDLVKAWLPNLRSALLIFDQDAGIRTFLSADPSSAFKLRESCDTQICLPDRFITSKALTVFEQALRSEINLDRTSAIHSDVMSAVHNSSYRFVPEMVRGVIEQVRTSMEKDGLVADDIAIVAPYMNDSLRFSLMTSLLEAGIPSQSPRPSRSLRDEPATNCMMTYALIAHPNWLLKPSRYDLRTAFMQTITNGDLIRADLLAQVCQPRTTDKDLLGSFQKIIPEMQERITYAIGERYEILRTWLLDYQNHPVNELDAFVSLLFGEVLSQPGFGFHDSYPSASVIAKLIESIQKFRKVVSCAPDQNNMNNALEYIRMVENGILASAYMETRGDLPKKGILVAPAHSFLLQNRPVKLQFWLDVGSLGWSKRPNQPLTHPYVLSRQWQADSKWTDAHELAANRQALLNVTTALIRRCRDRIILCTLDMNDHGTQERGLLLMALQQLYRKIAALEDGHV